MGKKPEEELTKKMEEEEQEEVKDVPSKEEDKKSPRVPTCALIKAALALSLAIGAGVGIGFAVGRGESSPSCADSFTDSSDAMIREYISQQVSSRCDPDALTTEDGYAQCRDLCSPAACCVGAVGRAWLPGGQRRLGLAGARSSGGPGEAILSPSLNGKWPIKSGTNQGRGGEVLSSCLGQELCGAYEGCAILYRDFDAENDRDSASSGGVVTGEDHDLFYDSDKFQEKYDAVQSEARAKCHTRALLSSVGVEACFETCAPAFEAGCFASEVRDQEDEEEGDLNQSGRGWLPGGGRLLRDLGASSARSDHRADGDSMDRDMCGAYATCQTLLHVTSADGFEDDLVAEAAVDAACDGTDYGLCRGVCDAAECCFADWDMFGGRRVLGDGGSEGDEGEEEEGGRCAAAGLSGLQCDHYLSCLVLLEGIEEGEWEGPVGGDPSNTAVPEGKGLSRGGGRL